VSFLIKVTRLVAGLSCHYSLTIGEYTKYGEGRQVGVFDFIGVFAVLIQRAYFANMSRFVELFFLYLL